jgi:hypothetical protein
MDRDANKRSKQWSTADKINGVGVLVAILGLTIPLVWHLYTSSQQPRVSVKWPNDDVNMTDNTFGSYGTAAHIPAGSDLWLIVRSGGDGRWYPTKRPLQVHNGSWQIRRGTICPAAGSQELVIYMIPEAEEGSLFAYINSKAGWNELGMNSVPVDSKVMASATVNVAKDKHVWC